MREDGKHHTGRVSGQSLCTLPHVDGLTIIRAESDDGIHLLMSKRNQWPETLVGYYYTFDMNGTRGYIAWIENDGTLGSLNSIPKVFCYELIEACTNPDLGSGFIVNGNTEIGDVCNSTAEIINGIAFQTYWSQAGKLRILPQSLRLFLKAKGVNHVRAVQSSGSVSLKSLMGL
jgi:hypothetical protein